jgi:hypothetical protein
VPDVAIFEALPPRFRQECDIRFVSYATGAATLAEAGLPVIDLGMHEDSPFLDLLVRVQRVIASEKPELVLSHEEFSALPAAKTLGLPAALLVDFFAPPDHIWSQCVRQADLVIFLERRGLFPEPQARPKIRYVGPVVRPLTCSRANRAEAREALGLPAAASVVSVIPGAWANEARAPLVDLVEPAFRGLPRSNKTLVWVAGHDAEALASRFQGATDVRVLPAYAPIERLMVASDVVITKANRGTTIDLASLGIPSISLSYGLNPIDEVIAPQIRTNLALQARGIDSAFLGSTLERLLVRAERGPALEPDPEYAESSGAHAAAEAIAAFAAEYATFKAS